MDRQNVILVSGGGANHEMEAAMKKAHNMGMKAIEKKKRRQQFKKLRREELKQRSCRSRGSNVGRWSKRGCSAGRWRKKEPGETATPGKSLPSTTDTDDTPMCETFDLLTVGTMVAEASRSLQSTSNTDDTPIGETPDMLTGSTLAERSVRSLLPTTDMGDTPIGETTNTLTGDMLATTNCASDMHAPSTSVVRTAINYVSDTRTPQTAPATRTHAQRLR